MELKNSKIFNKEIMWTVSAFCESQEIKDVDNFMYLCFKQGFDIKRYGLLGKTLNDGEKHLIKEVIVEKRVEVPVEVIKEVEKIVEVPVEVVKEIEKVITITNNKELEEKIFHLNEQIKEESKIFSTKTQEMENNFQKEMSKKDEEIDELRQSLDKKLDNTNEKMPQETLQKLRKEISDKNEKIKNLEKINQDLQNTRNPLRAIFMRGSNLNDTV